MRMYVIYDTLYEEYQMPFFMKNDNIARIEFDVFVGSMVDKAPEKEKNKTRSRFILCSFPRIEYNKETGAIITPEDKYVIEPESITNGEDNE